MRSCSQSPSAISVAATSSPTGVEVSTPRSSATSAAPAARNRSISAPRSTIERLRRRRSLTISPLALPSAICCIA
jgi:hypothetical protein